MEYAKGQTIKPKRVTTTGKVIFTNGVAECEANMASCTAYGYQWDKQTNSCITFRPTEYAVMNEQVLKIGNTVAGIRNEVKPGSFNNDISGVDNTVGRQVQNASISGKGNEIEDNIHNASVSGSFCKIQRQGERGIGGGNYSQLSNLNGYAQSSTIHAIARTTGAGTFIASVGGLNLARIPVQTHSVIIFDLRGTVIKEAGGNNWQFNQRIVATMENNRAASFCYVSNNIDCGPVDEGWTYPALLQLGDEEEGFGDLQVNVYGLAGVDFMYNIKIDLIETRTINDF